MKQVLKLTTAPAAALAVLAFAAMTAPAAAASPKSASQVDYCRTDVTAGTLGCGYASLEQCQAMSSGRGGSCSPNPFSANASSNAYAYQPKTMNPKARSKTQ